MLLMSKWIVPRKQSSYSNNQVFFPAEQLTYIASDFDFNMELSQKQPACSNDLSRTEASLSSTQTDFDVNMDQIFPAQKLALMNRSDFDVNMDRFKETTSLLR
jgi:hypothetical protein